MIFFLFLWQTFLFLGVQRDKVLMVPRSMFFVVVPFFFWCLFLCDLVPPWSYVRTTLFFFPPLDLERLLPFGARSFFFITVPSFFFVSNISMFPPSPFPPFCCLFRACINATAARTSPLPPRSIFWTSSLPTSFSCVFFVVRLDFLLPELKYLFPFAHTHQPSNLGRLSFFLCPPSSESFFPLSPRTYLPFPRYSPFPFLLCLLHWLWSWFVPSPNCLGPPLFFFPFLAFSKVTSPPLYVLSSHNLRLSPHRTQGRLHASSFPPSSQRPS